MTKAQKWAAEEGATLIQRREEYFCRLAPSLKVASKPLSGVPITGL